MSIYLLKIENSGVAKATLSLYVGPPLQRRRRRKVFHSKTTTNHNHMRSRNTTAGKRTTVEDEHRGNGNDPHTDGPKPNSVQVTGDDRENK
jgi:hypothetical protein